MSLDGMMNSMNEHEKYRNNRLNDEHGFLADPPFDRVQGFEVAILNSLDPFYGSEKYTLLNEEIDLLISNFNKGLLMTELDDAKKARIIQALHRSDNLLDLVVCIFPAGRNGSGKLYRGLYFTDKEDDSTDMTYLGPMVLENVQDAIDTSRFSKSLWEFLDKHED